MTRLTLAAAIAALLLMAMALGALLHALWRRPGRDPQGRDRRLAALAADLHAAEAALHAAERRAAEAEAAGAGAAAAARAPLESELAQTRAELAAAMDAIGDARRETAQWRSAYERFAGEGPKA